MYYLFNNIKDKDVYDSFTKALTTSNESDIKLAINKLVEISIREGFTGNLWQSYLLYTLIFNDNSYTRSIERKEYKKFDLIDSDLKAIYELFNASKNWMKPIVDFDYETKKTDACTFVDELKTKVGNTYEEFSKAVLDFYMNRGLSDMAVYRAFRVEDGKLSPIYNVLPVTFNDLIGYDYQKQLLRENTEFLINGNTYNNVLLYGDSGTGKSTSIKALLNEYFDQGLRIIEVYKHQMAEISKIIHTLKNRPYYYIIYMDDLSFEENEIEYKYLKSIIEGGIEPKPDNVAIYATSNRRHLIKETIGDNATVMDDLHRNETQAEKLSLAYRFGLQIYYSSLSPTEFKKMVKEMAFLNGIDMPDKDLMLEANKWELTYGSLSGRCATQFINYLKNKIKA